MMGMAACLAVYAFVSGCVVPPASFFPASAFNYVTFIHVIGIPVQVFRALCAVCAAVLIHGVLSIFALESKTRLERALEATHQAREALEVRVLERTRELAQVNQTLQFQATHDSLTGLLNRGAIVGILENELARALREHHSVGVILVDVDHFKKINDTQGHSAGDAVLFRAAQRMQACIRNYDSVGRYGGEEFLIVLPGCYSGMATARAEEIRHILSEPSPDPLESPITVSMGVASSFDPTRVEDLLSIVDAALYRAKHGGRNRVESVADSVNQASEFEI
jgi:diguanylate cyclase (GGDEF)-like protein